MSEALPFDGPLHVGSHELAAQFLRDGHSVFWLGCGYHLLGLIQGMLGVPRHRHVVRWWRDGPVEARPGLMTWHPISALPYRDFIGFRSTTVLRYHLRFSLPPVAGVLDEFGFSTPDLLWLSQSPNSPALAEMVTARKVAYRISDRYGCFPGIPPSIVDAEKELLARADAVFATARNLFDELPADVRPRSRYLPNGVDCDHFRRGDEAAPEPKDLRDLPHPRAVFIGMIGDWVDIALLERAATELGHVSFILIGPVGTDIGLLDTLPNVHVMGSRAYADLPGYLHHSDLGLIPFRKNSRTDAVNSNKLFQYFAASLPVVSTRLDEMVHLDSPALLADTNDDFLEKVMKAISERREPEQYLDFARANSWAARYECVKSAINM